MIEVDIGTDKSLEDASVSSQPQTKLSIIDHELNRDDMGLYHWLIWAVCATGFLLDMMWTQAFSLVLLNLQREFGFPDKDLGNLGTLYGAGMVVGAFVWGTLIDVIGRRVAFYGTAFVAGAFGMCFGAMNSFSGLQAITILVGFGTGGNIPVNSTIAFEYLPKHRYYLVTALAVFSQVGAVICTIVAFGFIPNYSCSPNLVSCRLTGGAQPCCSKEANMGWRYLFFTVSSITLLIFAIRFFIFPFHESPKFLISRGKDRAAVEVVRKIAAFNKRPCDLTVESLQEQCKETPTVEKVSFSGRLGGEISRVKLLFGSWKTTRITITIWIAWILGYWSIGTFSYFLPTILQRKNVAGDVSLTQTYIDYIIINAPGIVAAILSMLMVRSRMIGRKWTLVFSSAMTGVSLFLYSVVDTQASHVGLNVMIVFFQLLFNPALWGWTPEAFPTEVRGTGSGMAMVFGTLFATFGPLVAAQILARPNGASGVLFFAGSDMLACMLLLLCFPMKDMVAMQEV